MPVKASLLNLPKNMGSTSELIASVIRKAIFEGQYKADQPLRQDRLAKELNVSKIPLREALVQLKSEGLVVLLPSRGAIVSKLSLDEVKEIFSMRLVLESLAIEKAIPNIKKTDLIRAQAVLEIIDNEEDKSTWSDLNWQFHEILYKPSKMLLLLNSIQILHNNVARYLIIYLDLLSGANISQKEHWEILQAYSERNADKAKDILKTHLDKAQSHLLKYLSK